MLIKDKREEWLRDLSDDRQVEEEILFAAFEQKTSLLARQVVTHSPNKCPIILKVESPKLKLKLEI